MTPRIDHRGFYLIALLQFVLIVSLLEMNDSSNSRKTSNQSVIGKHTEHKVWIATFMDTGDPQAPPADPDAEFGSLHELIDCNHMPDFSTRYWRELCRIQDVTAADCQSFLQSEWEAGNESVDPSFALPPGCVD